MKKESDIGSRYILDYLDEAFPDRLPVREVTEFELGILVGQQQLINMLKHKLQVEPEKEEIIR